MFQRKLSLILLCLAVIIALQGTGAVLALLQAERKVVDGRIASDLHQSFVELSATKQRLRSWTTQYIIGAGGESAEREALYQDMVGTLDRLSALADESAQRDRAPALAAEHVARRDAIEVLAESVTELGRALHEIRPLPTDVPARQAWDSLDKLFEQSKGRDLRQVVSESIQREAQAMQRERAAADRSLRFMHVFWWGISLLLVGLAGSAAVYFNRALRRPIDALVNGARALRDGQLHHRIPIEGEDEFAVVAQGMNAMAADLERHGRLEARQRSQLEAQVRARTEALREANDALQRTDERRRQLLADISHELRTPTTAIRGEAEVTLRGKERPVAEYRDTLRRIVDISKQLAAVIDDLLTMARSDMEALTVVRQPVDLYHPLQQALAGSSAAAQRHAVSLGDNPLLPDVEWVLGDKARLTQLLMLLLDNAIRYSRPGEPVWVEADRLEHNGSQVLALRVRDEGIGIPAHELPHVFERHFRGAAARTHSASGSGLGLGIARRLAQAHNAELEVSNPSHAEGGGGTCVTLRLPLITREQAAAWNMEGEAGIRNSGPEQQP